MSIQRPCPFCPNDQGAYRATYNINNTKKIAIKTFALLGCMLSFMTMPLHLAIATSAILLFVTVIYCSDSDPDSITFRVRHAYHHCLHRPVDRYIYIPIYQRTYGPTRGPSYNPPLPFNTNLPRRPRPSTHVGNPGFFRSFFGGRSYAESQSVRRAPPTRADLPRRTAPPSQIRQQVGSHAEQGGPTRAARSFDSTSYAQSQSVRTMPRTRDTAPFEQNQDGGSLVRQQLGSHAPHPTTPPADRLRRIQLSSFSPPVAPTRYPNPVAPQEVQRQSVWSSFSRRTQTEHAPQPPLPTGVQRQIANSQNSSHSSQSSSSSSSSSFSSFQPSRNLGSSNAQIPPGTRDMTNRRNEGSSDGIRQPVGGRGAKRR